MNKSRFANKYYESNNKVIDSNGKSRNNKIGYARSLLNVNKVNQNVSYFNHQSKIIMKILWNSFLSHSLLLVGTDEETIRVYIICRNAEKNKSQCPKFYCFNNSYQSKMYCKEHS